MGFGIVVKDLGVLSSTTNFAQLAISLSLKLSIWQMGFVHGGFGFGALGVCWTDSRRGGFTKPNFATRNLEINDEFPYFGRSNSFYAEAVADCLEFIKRSTLSVD